MKNSFIALIIIGLIAITCLAGGCTVDDDINGPDDASPLPSEQLHVSGTHINWNEDISFHGSSTLPDGTLLRTQFYEEDEPIAWWPVDTDVQVQNGEWQMTVPLSENLTNLHAGSETIFHFEIWVKDNPSRKAIEYVIVSGPPRIP